MQGIVDMMGLPKEGYLLKDSIPTEYSQYAVRRTGSSILVSGKISMTHYESFQDKQMIMPDFLTAGNNIKICLGIRELNTDSLEMYTADSSVKLNRMGGTTMPLTGDFKVFYTIQGLVKEWDGNGAVTFHLHEEKGE